MIYKIIWVAEQLAFGLGCLILALLPAIIAVTYGNIARKGRQAFDPAEYNRITNIELAIFAGGYLLMIVAFLFMVAPTEPLVQPSNQVTQSGS